MLSVMLIDYKRSANNQMSPFEAFFRNLFRKKAEIEDKPSIRGYNKTSKNTCDKIIDRIYQESMYPDEFPYNSTDGGTGMATYKVKNNVNYNNEQLLGFLIWPYISYSLYKN